MNCPKCGAEMKEGSLYCEQCGEDIHIVPDFEPELEYNIEQSLHHIVEDMRDTSNAPKQSGHEELYFDRIAEVKEKSIPTKKKRHYGIWVLLGILICLLAGGTVAGVRISQYYSLEYQLEQAQRFAMKQDYEQAIVFYNRALELEPDSIELKFNLAEIYFLKNNKIEYEYLLRDIIKDKNATAEQLESAYGRLIAIYRAREDYQTINDLVLNSGNESIISKYQSYIVLDPEFSVKEGNYTSIQPLKLSTFGTGKIYYTVDGSEPDSNSSLYTAPILLEEGDYCIKAVYVNEKGMSGNVVSKKYHIEIEELPMLEVNAASGEYQFPIDIEVVGEYEAIYYTTDGSEPNADSKVYSGPIHMPLGKSTYKFIRIEDGRSSPVVELQYNLVMNTVFTPEQAVNKVIEYSMGTGKIFNEIGNFDDSGAAYKYEYQYVTNINGVDDFYVISEIFRTADLTLTKTGTHFAVNAYTKEIYKLQIDDNNNYTLVEIEKETLY